MKEYWVWIASGLSCAGFAFVLLNYSVSVRSKLFRRLSEIRLLGSADEEDEYKGSFLDRVVGPLYRAFLQGLSSLAPKTIYKRYETLLNQAGLSKRFGAVRVIGVQVLSGLITLTLLLYLLPGSLFIAGTAAFFAGLLPYILLAGQADRRRALIEESLPDFIDLLHLCVEAGLSFDLGLRRTAEHSTGALSEEAEQALYEIGRGRERTEALTGMAERTRSVNLRSFIQAMLQAEELGVNMTNTLRAQAADMRQKSRQRIEEQSAKLATKMLFPIIFMIFPALMAIILGPALLRVLDTIGSK